MSHSYQLTLAETHQKLPVVLALCLLMAGIPPAGAANLRNDGLPVAVDRPIDRPTADQKAAARSIFACELSPAAPPSCRTEHRADDSGGTQPGAARGDASATDDETIVRIVSNSGCSTQTFWDANKAWTGILTDPSSNDKMDWARINDGGLKEGRFGNIIPGVAAVTADTVPTGGESVHPAPPEGSVIPLAGVLLVTCLIALLGYCAVVSCTPATRSKPVPPNTPCSDAAHERGVLTMDSADKCQPLELFRLAAPSNTKP